MVEGDNIPDFTVKANSQGDDCPLRMPGLEFIFRVIGYQSFVRLDFLRELLDLPDGFDDLSSDLDGLEFSIEESSETSDIFPKDGTLTWIAQNVGRVDCSHDRNSSEYRIPNVESDSAVLCDAGFASDSIKSNISQEEYSTWTYCFDLPL